MKQLKILFLIIFYTPLIISQSTDGFWKTRLIIPGDTLTIYLELNNAESDARLTVKEQMLYDYKASEFYNEDSLLIEFPALKAKIYGSNKTVNDSLILLFDQGLFKQYVRLGRTDTPLFKNRPQNPVPPLPYSSENVKIENAGAGIKLAGTLTIPENVKNPPAVILVSGSGAQNRNMDIMGHSYFLVIADYLTRNGYAVLRCDDRGTAESEGDFSKATTADFATDVSAQADFLAAHPAGFDKKRIGVLGISEGGMIAPLASLQNSGITFLILLSAPGVTGGEILSSQSHIINTIMGEDPAQVAVTDCIMEGVVRHIQSTGNDSSLVKVIGAIYDECLEKGEIDKKKFKSDPRTGKRTFTAVFNSPWMLYFTRLNPKDYLPEVKIPMLAINGTLDLQVHVSVNQKPLEELIRRAGNPLNETVVFENLNHLLQKADKGLISEYADITTTIEPEVLEKMLEWLKKL